MSSAVSTDVTQHPSGELVKPPVPHETDGGDRSTEWTTSLQREARCIPCDPKPLPTEIPKLNPATHRSKYVLISSDSSESAFAKCICVDGKLNMECPAYIPGDESLDSWQKYGCGCEDCEDCYYDYRDCMCDCGIPRDHGYPKDDVPPELMRPLVLQNDVDPTCKVVIPSKWGTVKEKDLVAKLVPWAPCVREDCACTASYNGMPGEHCCNGCYNGRPYKYNKHSRPPPNQCWHCSEYVWDIQKHLKRCPVKRNSHRGKDGGGGYKGRSGRR